MKIIFFYLMQNNIILISSNSAWNLLNFRINLIKNLLNRKYKIIILIPSNDRYSDLLKSIGCEVYTINFNSRKKSLLEAILLFFKYFYFFYKINPKYYLSFTIKPNLIGTLSSIIFNVKVINNITGLGSVFIQNNLIIKLLVLICYKIIFLKSYVVFFQNKKDLNYFVKNSIINKKKAILIPGSGINISLYDYNLPVEKKEKNFQFLFFGRIISEKGIIDLVEAIKIINKKISNISFLLIGDTDENDKKYKQISQYINNSSGLFTYKKHSDNIAKYIKNSDCVILPSHREGMPRSLLEAASYGVPIIASDVPGCNDIIINKKTGLLFKAKDPSDIVDKLIYFINMTHKEKIILSKNARNKIEKEFDESIVIKSYNKYIN